MGDVHPILKLPPSTVTKVKDTKTAELVKVAEGIYRDVNIALANELFMISEELGIDYDEVRSAANHEYCNLHVQGNVGGHCIPVYPYFLTNGFQAPLIRTARKINDDMVNYYADKIKDAKSILVYGITYREGVKETAYSRSFAMIKLLKNRGYDVFVFDPMYSKEELQALDLEFLDDFDKMDCIMIMNRYPELNKTLSDFKNKIIDIKGSLK